MAEPGVSISEQAISLRENSAGIVFNTHNPRYVFVFRGYIARRAMDSQHIVLAAVIVLLVVLIAVFTGRLGLAAAGAIALVGLSCIAGAQAWTAGSRALSQLGGAEPSPPFELKDFEHAPATEYSSPRGDQILQEICYFRRLGGSVKRVVDATAHVGVDTAVLAHSFPDAKIVAIEWDPDNYEKLKRNLDARGIADRVETLNMSAVDYFDGTPPGADLVYMDPPWGGRDYRRVDDLPFLGKPKNTPMHKVINDALKIAPIVVAKVPYNFDYLSLERRLDGVVASVVRIHYPNEHQPMKVRRRAVFNLLEIRKNQCREE